MSDLTTTTYRPSALTKATGVKFALPVASIRWAPAARTSCTDDSASRSGRARRRRSSGASIDRSTRRRRRTHPAARRSSGPRSDPGGASRSWRPSWAWEVTPVLEHRRPLALLHGARRDLLEIGKGAAIAVVGELLDQRRRAGHREDAVDERRRRAHVRVDGPMKSGTAKPAAWSRAAVATMTAPSCRDSSRSRRSARE